eukprot:TRINITY_DN36125_c0_g1_i1.p1 TRINITY_DN36125_c0_g1~~TRINITY_DN36125_c0_g1_i1.p1  ORF type:complete len:651 (+),score=135.21 TRINITY_DN36125_c0_g1_i1:960-2912(+)
MPASDGLPIFDYEAPGHLSGVISASGPGRSKRAATGKWEGYGGRARISMFDLFPDSESGKEEDGSEDDRPPQLQVQTKKTRTGQGLWVLAFLGGAARVVGGILLDGLGFVIGLGAGVAVATTFLKLRRSLAVERPTVRRITDIQDEEKLEQLLQLVPEWVKDPGLERVAWINAVIAKAWPHIDVVAVDMFKKNIWPFVKEKCLECGMTVKFCSMALGDLPPVFDSVKAVETLGDECIIESTVKFATNASLVCEIGAFGLTTLCQISEVHATGVCRITLAPLTPEFPCFAGIRVALMEMPEVDAKVAAVGGLDLMVIPRVKPLTLHIIQEVLAKFLLWPNHFLFPLQHQALQGTRHAVGTVTLLVLAAKNLRYTLSLPSPYVKVFMDENRTARTTTKEATANPLWHERLMLAVDDPEKDVMSIRVMDYEPMFRDKFLGTAFFPVKGLKPDVTQRVKLNLHYKGGSLLTSKAGDGGQIEIEATFRRFQEGTDWMEASAPLSPDPSKAVMPLPMKPAGGAGSGLLEVIVLRGMDLEPYKDGHIQAFCKIFIGHDVRKTRVVQHLTNPQWDEEFEFLFETPPVNSKMRVEVWHSNEDSSSTLTTLLSASARRLLLGSVEVRLKDVIENQRMRDVFQLNQAKQGQLLLEMSWRRH